MIASVQALIVLLYVLSLHLLIIIHIVHCPGFISANFPSLQGCDNLQLVCLHLQKPSNFDKFIFHE